MIVEFIDRDAIAIGGTRAELFRRDMPIREQLERLCAQQSPFPDLPPLASICTYRPMSPAVDEMQPDASVRMIAARARAVRGARRAIGKQRLVAGHFTAARLEIDDRRAVAHTER
jgi:hypothetical protein